MARGKPQAATAAMLAAALTMLAGAGQAPAHDKTFKSRVTIEHPSAPVYEGDVFSGSHACVRRRTVQFWFDNTAGPDELIDASPANAEGHWRFKFIGSAYYAKVSRIVKTPRRHHHVCKGDRSPTISG